MNFKILQLFERIDYDQDAISRMVHYLRNLPPYDAGQGLDYLINGDVEHENEILVGSISEEYIPFENEVNDQKVLEPVEDIEPYERTIFAFDFNTRNLLIQNRNYPPNNLNPGRTTHRLIEILTDAFRVVFNSNFNLIATQLPQTNEVFERIFNTSRVIEVQFSEINQNRRCERAVSEDQVINDGILRFWNNDESLMDSLMVKATNEGEINDNPLVRVARETQGVLIDKVKYYEEDVERLSSLKRSEMDKYDIPDLPKNTESVTAFQQILNSIPLNRTFLRNVRHVD